MLENNSETLNLIKWRRYTAEDLEIELGEIERVVNSVLKIEPAGDTYEDTVRALWNKILTSELQELNDDLWMKLENTDSWENILSGDIKEAEECARQYGKNFHGQMEAIKRNVELPAPIILDYNGILHLVSGNTRLMISRGLKQRPKVIIIKYP